MTIAALILIRQVVGGGARGMRGGGNSLSFPSRRHAFFPSLVGDRGPRCRGRVGVADDASERRREQNRASTVSSSSSSSSFSLSLPPVAMAAASNHANTTAASMTTAAASAATAAESVPLLTYDRDTGVIWEASEEGLRIRPLYQTVIGIEIHAQLSVPTKLFSPALVDDGVTSAAAVAANSLVHPYDLAYPGTLPSLSASAVRMAVLSAASLGCTVHRTSRFERKHYFYPDLPAGYQITQQRWPLASDGCLEFWPKGVGGGGGGKKSAKKGGKERKSRGGKERKQQRTNEEGPLSRQQSQEQPEEQRTKLFLRIDRIQLEQDTGKTTTISDFDDKGGGDGGGDDDDDDDNRRSATFTVRSLIDLNRAGRALVEIVSRPDLRSAHAAAGAVEEVRTRLRFAGTCDGRMEEGSLRCDLNISVAPIMVDGNDEGGNGAQQLQGNGDDDSNDNMEEENPYRSELPPGTGQRVEVKNLNSLRQIVLATEYEALRQATLAGVGQPTGLETRTFLPRGTTGGETIVLRTKGGAVDYRFLPEPDLGPLILDGVTLESIGAKIGETKIENFLATEIPESPDEALARLVADCGLSEDVATVLVADPPSIGLFKGAVKSARDELLSNADGGRSDEEDAKSLKILQTAVANWLTNDIFALIKKSATAGVDNDDDEKEDGHMGGLNHPISAEFSAVQGDRLGQLVAMVSSGDLTVPMAKKVLSVMYFETDSNSSSPRDVAERNGWKVISDFETLCALCRTVVLDDENTSQLEQYKKGGKFERKMEKFYVGKIMKASGGNAHPERTREALGKVLENVVSGVTD